MFAYFLAQSIKRYSGRINAPGSRTGKFVRSWKYKQYQLIVTQLKALKLNANSKMISPFAELSMKSKCIFSCLILIFSSLIVEELVAQQSGYQLPPKAIVDIVDAKPTPFVSLSPDAEWMLMVDRDAMPDIADVSRRMLQLAGIRIDPASNGRFQTSYLRGITLRNRSADPSGIQNEETHFKIPMPENPKVSSISWSHNSKNFAFVLVTDKGQQLWVSSVETPKAPKMLTDRLNTVMGGFSWMPDGKSIVCRLVPEERGAEPETSNVPTGPNIQESYGNKSCLLYTSPSPRDLSTSRMPSSA